MLTFDFICISAMVKDECKAFSFVLGSLFCQAKNMPVTFLQLLRLLRMDQTAGFEDKGASLDNI